MRLIIVIVFVLLHLEGKTQSLKNTEWLQVTIESNDSKKNINLLQPGEQSLKYFFCDSTVLFSLIDIYEKELKYALTDSSLTIGDNIRYKVDTITDQFLIATEIPKKGNLSPVTVTFLNTDFLFDYAKKIGRLTIIGDSLVMANSLFSPAYKGDIHTLFLSKFEDEHVEGKFKGYFTLSPEGYIRDISFIPGNKYKKKDIDAISSALNAMHGSWIIPPTPKPYSFRMSFVLSLTYFAPMVGANVTFNRE